MGKRKRNKPRRKKGKGTFDRYIKDQLNPRRRDSMRVLEFTDDKVSDHRYRVLLNAYATNEGQCSGLDNLKKAAALMEGLETIMSESIFDLKGNQPLPDLKPGTVILEEAPFDLLLEWINKMTPWFTGAAIWIVETHEWLKGLPEASKKELAEMVAEDEEVEPDDTAPTEVPTDVPPPPPGPEPEEVREDRPPSSPPAGRQN